MRTCGTCTLCCKVMAIAALKKPMNKWCEFCDKGAGCKIYPEPSIRVPDVRLFVAQR